MCDVTVPLLSKSSPPLMHLVIQLFCLPELWPFAGKPNGRQVGVHLNWKAMEALLSGIHNKE